MAVTGGVVERFGSGDPRITHTTAAAVTEGRLVELTAGRTIQHAGAGSTKVVGVAMQTSDAAGDKLAVATGGVWNLVASGAIAAGDLLVAAAAGKVSTVAAVDPASLATEAAGQNAGRAIIGEALEAIADTASGPVLLRIA